jgi:iron complex outermembrane recepter protein
MIPYRRLAALAALLLLTQTGLAQQLASAGDDAGSGTSAQLKEIVVTAERRVQNELTVPLALQAMTASQLSENHIENLTDLQFTTPGYLPTSGEGYTQIYIRGVGNNIFVGADPSVATFVDGVPRIYGSLNQNFLDVERVEVLKGAQGGLYGRNATGGVVNIITYQPSTTQPFSGDSLIDYGEMGTFRAAAWTNMPVSDSVAFLFSMERDSHGPYVKNLDSSSPYTAAMFPSGSAFGTPAETADLLNSHVHPDPGLDNQDYWASDDKMLLKPTDSLKITVAGDYSAKVDSGGSANVDITPAYAQAYLTGLLTAFGFNPNLPPGVDRGANGSFTLSEGDAAYVDTWDYGGSVTAVWSAPSVDVTSISAYRGQTTNFASGANGGSAPDVDEEVDIHRDFAYQELRAQSTSASAFSWIGGATYLTSNVSSHTGVALLGGLAPAADIRSVDTVHNWSVYGLGTYDITPLLSLTVSYRYEHETNVADYTVPTVATAGANLSKSIPSATLSYKLGDDGNVYVRWARGVKSGGVNPTTAPSNFPQGAPGEIFAPEQVDTYEAGYRHALFNHSVQLTTDVFYNNYNNMQFTDHANPAYSSTIILAIVNARSARTYGAEESLDWRLAAPVTVGINLGYLDATYTNAELMNSPVLASFDYNGKTMLNAPRWQGSFTGDLDQPLTGRLDLVGNVVVSYISRTVFDYSEVPGVLPDADGPAYWLTNARIGVQTSDGRYSLSLYAKNLFNRVYYTYGNAATTGDLLLWGDPRVIGGEVTARF